MTIAALEALSSRIPWSEPAVLESVFELALEIAREGREGRRIGTLFTVGKADEVRAASRAQRPGVVGCVKRRSSLSEQILDLFEAHPDLSRMRASGMFFRRANGDPVIYLVNGTGHQDTAYFPPVSATSASRCRATGAVCRPSRSAAPWPTVCSCVTGFSPLLSASVSVTALFRSRGAMSIMMMSRTSITSTSGGRCGLQQVGQTFLARNQVA